MKNILLSSFLALVTVSNVYAAELSPKVTISGKLNFQAAVVKESSAFETTNPATPNAATAYKHNKRAFANDTELNIRADGKLNSNVGYGGLIKLNVDTSPSRSEESSVADSTMIYFQHNKIGRIEGGSMLGAAAQLGNDVTYFDVGSYGAGGFNTLWQHNRSAKVANTFNRNPYLQAVIAALPGSLKGAVPQTRSLEFMIYSDLPSNYIGRYYSKATKINFYTQPIPELTIGLAYIPDFDNTGTVSNRAPKNGGPVDERQALYPATFRNIFSGGISFNKKINNDLSFKAMLVGEVGKAKWAEIHDLKAYKTGFKATYKTFQFGATYGSWGKTLGLKVKPAGMKQASNFWTVGFAQHIDKFGYSVTYLNSKKAGGIEILTPKINKQLGTPLLASNTFSDPAYNKYNNLTLDVDYKLADGFLPYAAFSMFKFKESTGTKDKGYIGMIGTRLVF